MEMQHPKGIGEAVQREPLMFQRSGGAFVDLFQEVDDLALCRVIIVVGHDVSPHFFVVVQ
jgi:hypothetical protein